MTLFINIKNKLKKYFILRDEKDAVWSNYLKSEMKYVNGEIHFHHTASIYHSQQTPKTVAYTLGGTNETFCELRVKNDSFHEDQINQATAHLDNELISIHNKSVDNGIAVGFDNTYEGLLKIKVPPVNVGNDIYTGLEYQQEIRGQGLSLTSYNHSNNMVSVVVETQNAFVNQQVRCATLYRNGKIDNSKTVTLQNNQSAVSIDDVPVGSTDKGFMVELLPFKKNNIVYTGKKITQNW